MRQRPRGGDAGRYANIPDHSSFTHWRPGAKVWPGSVGFSRDGDFNSHEPKSFKEPPISFNAFRLGTFQDIFKTLGTCKGLTAFAERSPTTPRRNWLSRLGRGLRSLLAKYGNRLDSTDWDWLWLIRTTKPKGIFAFHDSASTCKSSKRRYKPQNVTDRPEPQVTECLVVQVDGTRLLYQRSKKRKLPTEAVDGQSTWCRVQMRSALLLRTFERFRRHHF